MKTFFTSDNHYFHSNIIRLSGRPFQDVSEMNDRLIDVHNSTVSDSDTVYFLGDFSFGGEFETLKVIRQLKGCKHLVIGNHDKMIAKHPNGFIGQDLFRTIETYKEIKLFGQKICLFHYSCRVWNKSHYNSWLLHGHSHGTLEPYGKSVDVGVDAKFITNGYEPLEFEQVKDFMSTRNRQIVDHHE